ncbi:MAG: purine-nucleoside phosphorylase [Deltaproteobacteria bacterium]|nr:purine-nucleoside phosphorylase [Deltaproteobacteria bacterium]
MSYQDYVSQAANYIRNRLPEGYTPRVAVTLGTGLSGLGQAIEEAVRVPYQEVPCFPVSTVDSHAGELVLGRLAGQPVAALAGRFHLYEGYSARQVTLPIRALALLGVDTFMVTCAAGGLDPAMESGRVMLINDHINFTGDNPLIGPNVDQWGERFPDMCQVYDPQLLALARTVAQAQGIAMYEGVYIGLKGPSMETPAETRMLRTLGGDAVGMSTVLEVIAARHAGLKVMGLAAISNVNIPEDMQPAPLELVIENAGKAGEDMSRIIMGVLEEM